MKFMHLDIMTLMAMEGFVSACVGGVFLFASLQNRKTRALPFWALAYVAHTAGIIALMMGAAAGRPIWAVFGGNLLSLGNGFTWKAARSFDAKPAPLPAALLGATVAGLLGLLPATRDIAELLALVAGSVYLGAAAFSLWLGGKTEPLAARMPLIFFISLHAAVVSVGAFSFSGNATDMALVPALTSVFGLVHFESVVYALGTAVFVLVMAKERGEAASRAAASVDPLTGIANRAAFLARAERALERCRHDGAPTATVMFDLDRFKGINDSHGHAIGDAVIQKFCEVAAAVLRPSDIFGRMGGEEFAVLLPGSSIEAASARAEKIRVSFSETCRFIGNHQVNATVSAGVSVSMDSKQSLNELLEASDAALYRAKSGGRNRIERADRPRRKVDQSTVIRMA
jgi:diguanylate cyclase (GGDEF)-like protein